MSFTLTREDRKLLIAAGAVSLALIAVAAILSPRTNVLEVPTTYSAGSNGAKAAYLLLQRSGYHVTRWEESLANLDDGGSKGPALQTERRTLVLAEPQGSPTSAERLALLRFLGDGGRLLAIGESAAFFTQNARVRPEFNPTWSRLRAVAPTSITRAAPAITLVTSAFWDRDDSVIPLYADAGDDVKLRVVTFPQGRGTVVWWASATPLTNAGLREPGNLEFFLASIGDKSASILWDESFHGYRGGEGASLWSFTFTVVSLHLAVFALGVLATFSRRSGPTVPAVSDRYLSPLEFVRTLGSLYQQAGAAAIVVDIAFQQFTYRLTKRVGLAGRGAADDIDRALAGLGPRAHEIGELMRDCEAARQNPDLTPDAALALTARLADASALLDLDRSLERENR